MATPEEIDRLVNSFDQADRVAERAHLQLSRMGSAAVPRLITALKGGTMRRFYAARTLGKIGIDAECGLISLDEAMRQAALKAVSEALEYESNQGGDSVSEQLCQSLQRARENLARSRTTAAEQHKQSDSLSQQQAKASSRTNSKFVEAMKFILFLVVLLSILAVIGWLYWGRWPF